MTEMELKSHKMGAHRIESPVFVVGQRQLKSKFSVLASTKSFHNSIQTLQGDRIPIVFPSLSSECQTFNETGVMQGRVLI